MDDFKIKIFGMDFESNAETALGEPSLILYLPNDTSIEITHEEDGVRKEEQYFSVRHHCSNEDFDNDTYRATMGIISEGTAETEEEVSTMIEKYFKQLGVDKDEFIVVNLTPKQLRMAHDLKEREYISSDFEQALDEMVETEMLNLIPQMVDYYMRKHDSTIADWEQIKGVIRLFKEEK